jgi:hypothetical protein
MNSGAKDIMWRKRLRVRVTGGEEYTGEGHRREREGRSEGY